MSTGNFNGLDPIQAEKIRRGTHIFAPDPVRGGMNTYQPAVYKHQEYPKMMIRRPRPEFKSFKKALIAQQTDNDLQALLLGQKLDMQSLFDAACQEWDEESRLSIVHNKEEEEQWLAENPESATVQAVNETTKEKASEIKATRAAQIAAHPVNSVRKPGTV